MKAKLGCLAALLLGSCDALRSCTKGGQVRVPCADELLLGRSDRFLLTLFGHSCYTMNIVSPQPLEVQFYDSRDLKSGQRNAPAVRSLQSKDEINATVTSLAALGDNKACHNVLSCYQLQEGLSKATVYNLMISRWANVTEDGGDQAPDAPIRVAVELEHCDPVSPWHYVGLVFVGSIGFTSTMLLLCIVGEFVLGLRTITKLQQAAQRDRFVELAQIDPTKTKKDVEKSSEDSDDSEELEPTAPLMPTGNTADPEPTAEPEARSPA
ncbi:hypothetical protein PF005_g24599 [Phytophthora fragariae]|uniref:Uncharacterized protein n=2 Tax=Phytophthora TaxID=4783 RepID=A0A6A3QIE9_9STRA|nr:hypothetical protein PF003_g34245 [Phytophthora fragariae]KAE8987145.1 hypothetical protein PR002_g22134 [Phytophthora rubi]KAE8924401.1 hypothetical protein PF009_g25366 [Phytophthora fragariae]KAE8977761.1 hypothetical protein PF011_g23520 [Phytophthora fragariae]KAE9076513.1 hypothetical protein PF007_g24599 [Phytophthora fragariae]